MQNIALRIFVSTFSALVFGIVPVRAQSRGPQSSPPLAVVGSAAAPAADPLDQPVAEMGATIDAYAVAAGVSRGEAMRRLGRIQAALR